MYSITQVEKSQFESGNASRTICCAAAASSCGRDPLSAAAPDDCAAAAPPAVVWRCQAVLSDRDGCTGGASWPTADNTSSQ